MSAPDTTPRELRDRIDAFLASTGLVSGTPRIVPLTPDASDRRYFRVVKDASAIVLAVYSGPIDFATMPYANVARMLARLDVSCPAILAHDDALGIVAQEDLGDVTLQAHLGAASASEHAALYREAVSLIHHLQARGRTLDPAGWIPYTLAFDVDKLTFELNFFAEHFLAGYRGVELSSSEQEALAEEWSAIVGELAAETRVVCHRDYHSRNLMLHEGRLFMIDFQDARMGPDTYDLASLLRDSYVSLPDLEVEELIVYFCALSGTADLVEFRRRFDLMSVQRNLKALGTFGFQASARRNPAYIQYMPRTLGYVRANFEKYHRFARLRGLLGPHLDELR